MITVIMPEMDGMLELKICQLKTLFLFIICYAFFSPNTLSDICRTGPIVFDVLDE